MSTRVVIMAVEVRAPDLLREAAEQRAVREGMQVEDWRRARADGAPINNDLRMLLDPGESPPGTKILETDARED